MNQAMRARAPLCLYTLISIVTLTLTGCGGGGGGGTQPPLITSRSYGSLSATRPIALSLDKVGRLTVFAADAALLPNGAAGQGSVSTDGRFAVQAGNGLVISGTISATEVAGIVQQVGVTLFSFSAPLIAPGRNHTSAYSGTYSGASGVNSALLTIDDSAHATLFATANGITDGGLLSVAETGAFGSADGSSSITGQITVSGTDVVVRIDRLNGIPVNATLTLNPLTRAKWTFLVFLNGANNLDEFGPLNVNQMEKVGSTKDLNIVVQWKRANCGTCGNPEWTGTRRYFITKDNNDQDVSSQVVQNLGSNIDMGDWRELRSFIQWGQQHYPADRYALVIWNHGAGWRPTRAGDRTVTAFPRSVSIDDSTNNEIQTWQLPQSLSGGQRLDMVVFDASLMQMTEVAYEIRDVTGVVVGSEESPPGEGYVYDPFLNDLAQNPNMTPQEFGAAIVQRTLQSYGHSNNLTQSALDTSRLQNLANKIDSFATTMEANLAAVRDAAVFARRNAESYTYADNKDLWHYAELIKQNTASNAVKTAATEVQTAIDSAVIEEDHGTVNGNSHGMAIYVPAPIDFLTSYGNLAFARATSWDRWLQSQPSQ